MKRRYSFLGCALLLCAALCACAFSPAEVSTTAPPEPETAATAPQTPAAPAESLPTQPPKVLEFTTSSEPWTEAPENEHCSHCKTGLLVLENYMTTGWCTFDFVMCPQNPRWNDLHQKQTIFQHLVCNNPDCQLVNRQQTVEQTQLICDH